MNKIQILSKLKELQPKYEKEGLLLLGLFGSYAKGEEKTYSDIDIAYRLDYEKFSKKYKGGFSKLVRIDDIKKELENLFKKPVDLVPDKNKDILKDILYV